MAGEAAAAAGSTVPAGPVAAGPLAPGPLGTLSAATAATAPASSGMDGIAAAAAAVGGYVFLDKAKLVKRVKSLISGNMEAYKQWRTFCNNHEAGGYDPEKQDEAFLATFVDAQEAGEITVPEEMEGTGEGGKAGEKGGWGGGGYGSWGGGASGGWGGSAGGKGGAGGGSLDACKVFVGGLPKQGVSEEALKKFVSQFGNVANLAMKYLEDGSFRGFCFVTFDTPDMAQNMINASQAGRTMFEGKRVDCKEATGTKGGSKGKDKDGAKGGGKSGGWDGNSWGGGRDNNNSSWGSSGDWGGNWGGASYGKSSGKEGMKGVTGASSKGKEGGGASWEGGKGAGGKSKDRCPPEKIFVGGIPKSANEQTIWTHFGQFGKVANVDLKFDEMGGFRGFGFVTFQDKCAADAVIANGPNNQIDGKWVDCKTAGGDGAKGKDKGSKGDGKGDKGCAAKGMFGKGGLPGNAMATMMGNGMGGGMGGGMPGKGAGFGGACGPAFGGAAAAWGARSAPY